MIVRTVIKILGYFEAIPKSGMFVKNRKFQKISFLGIASKYPEIFVFVCFNLGGHYIRNQNLPKLFKQSFNFFCYLLFFCCRIFDLLTIPVKCNTI